MKKRLRLLSLCIACLLFIGCAFTACSQDKPQSPGQGEETPLPEPPGENPGGGDNPGETPENPGGGNSGDKIFMPTIIGPPAAPVKKIAENCAKRFIACRARLSLFLPSRCRGSAQAKQIKAA